MSLATVPIASADDAPLRFGGRLPIRMVLALIALLTVAAYWPALGGGLLWDDEGHITKPALRSFDGLRRIWFELGATQQYYPLLHSFFWVQYQLWGDNLLGYHLVNLLLHLAAAYLVYLVMRKLQIPGALLAAGLFALHPVHVETVAWITEQKNTLSTVFYLSAMLAYLQFDESRRRSWYALALVLFLLGLFSKTVTATLPAALLVIFWWQRGSLSWRRDVLPLLPFFACGAVGGLFTAYVERKLIGAEGEDFNLSLVERGLLAGRVVWFYLGKLLWPTNLIFMYPRWEIDATDWRQWLFPATLLAGLALLWAVRGRTRAPLAAALFFIGTLFPVLGFLNVYPFKFSFVADHFQYLASLGVIVLVSAAIARGVAAIPAHFRWIGQAACVALLSVMAWLTWQQSRTYGDLMTLYETTLDRNPSAFLIQNNVGSELVKQNKPQEALKYFQESLRNNPRYALAHNNLGLLLLGQGQPEEAKQHFEEAIRLKPNHPDIYNNLAGALFKMGRPEEAVRQCHEALVLFPDFPAARGNLGNILLGMGRPQEAIEQYQEALRIKPDFAEVHDSLGVALINLGQTQQAIEHFQTAIRLMPDLPDTPYNLSMALLSLGRVSEAIPHLKEAARRHPDDIAIQNNLGSALLNTGQPEQAVECLEQAVRARPELPETRCNLGRALIQSGRQQEAIAELEEAVRLRPEFTEAHANLADALEQLRRLPEAIAAAEKALEQARAQAQSALVEQLEARLAALRGEKSPSPQVPAPALPPPP